MTLARKDLLDHIMTKPEHAMLQETAEWKDYDLKNLAILAKLLIPNYQLVVWAAGTAYKAWETLRSFFVKQSLHNRVQLRKQFHEFEMVPGTNLIDHLMSFDELCLRLLAVGDTLNKDEELVILLGSVSQEYETMVKIIEDHGNVTLLEAKEMLRWEFETLQKREKKEAAFKVAAHGSDGGNEGSRDK
uniref:Putative polyprotein n=1 Tax=Albugo laibachii Nc14 TaxID=890382 RepID=F0W4L5_9STRA|nr:putative polyprotein [Albugo laibachii Nc14]|eukprot:CCA16049.1 putative polyprotein [Albugo laibachii Nc14]